MADNTNDGSTVVRSSDGIFYKVPDTELEQYAIAPEDLKSVLSEVAAGSGPGGGPGFDPRGGPKGGPVVINVNLGEVSRGMAPGPPPEGQAAEAGAAVAGYMWGGGGGHCCYRSCYRSCC